MDVAQADTSISFLVDDLDDVHLTQEEYLYVKFRLPDSSVEHLNSAIGEFHFASSGSSGSNDSSPDREKTDDQQKGKTQSHADKLYKDLLSSHLESYTISSLFGYSACGWNQIPDRVYAALKVTSFIVKPNQFLSVSAAECSEDRSILDMDNIFNVISVKNPSNFPSWDNVLRELEKLLPVFDGFKSLNDKLQYYKSKTGRREALDMVHVFHKHMREIQDECMGIRSEIEALKKFAQELSKAIYNRSILETLSQTYIAFLLQYFQHCTHLKLHCREKHSADLKLQTKNGTKTLKVEPDLRVDIWGSTFLVGEVKRLGAIIPEDSGKGNKDRNKERLAKNSRSKCQAAPISSGVAIPSAACLNEQNDSCQTEGHTDVENTEKEHVEPKLSCKAADTKNVEPTGHEGKLTSKLKTTESYYRSLYAIEAVKVDIYLPQLIAEMLACMESNTRPDVQLGHDYENVQLGFAMEGFKLRFVKLVLRSTDQAFKPRVSDLKERNVRCDVFLTKEFNLFNPRHVKMFFHFLFAIAYTYS